MGTEVAGVKHDQNKIKPRLIINSMPRALAAVSTVATYGANKYTEDGWVNVPNAEHRYTDAMYRHLLQHAGGETHDEESRLHHLAHAAWNALAVLELALRNGADLTHPYGTAIDLRTGELKGERVMVSVEIEVDFKGMSYVVEIDMDNYDGVSFENTAVAALTQSICDDPPEGFDEEDTPEDLNGFGAWWVLDVFGMPPQLVGDGSIRRLADLETAFEVAQHDDIDFGVWCTWCDENNCIYSASDYHERYCGAFDNEGDYAAELLNDCLGSDKTEHDMVRNYIDYEGMERDMVLSGDIDVIEHGGRRHIFRAY